MDMNDNYGMVMGYPNQQLPSMSGNNVQGFQQQNQKFPMKMLKGWAVTSIEEARLATIETDGSMFFLPDLTNKRIYTKQLNPDGTATFNMYEQRPVPDPPSGNYVTVEEFHATLDQIKGLLQQILVPQQASTQPVQQEVKSQQPGQQQTSNEIVI